MDDQELVKIVNDDDFKAYTGIQSISYKAGVLSLGSNDVVLADSYKIFVSDEGEGHKSVLETGKVYRVVVNGVASNEVKG